MYLARPVTAAASGPGAAHVADREPPAVVADGEHVIEVAADLVSLPGRRVLHREIHAGHPRHLRRQQAALQRPAGLQLLRVQPRVVERERRPAAEIFHHLDGLAREPVTAGPADDERAEHPPARDERAAPDGVGGEVGRTGWAALTWQPGK